MEEVVYILLSDMQAFFSQLSFRDRGHGGNVSFGWTTEETIRNSSIVDDT